MMVNIKRVIKGRTTDHTMPKYVCAYMVLISCKAKTHIKLRCFRISAQYSINP